MVKVAFVIFVVYSVCMHSTGQMDAYRVPDIRASGSKEKELISHLLRGYDRVGRLGRPVNDSNATVLVKYGLSLIQILDLDERNQVLTVNVWVNYNWKDEFLVWNPEYFNNISSVRIPANSIWLPDIKLYNYADERLTELRETLVVVYNDGSVLWIPQAIYKSSCSIDITHFPFDEQTCVMKFGSWSYDGAKLDVAFYFPEGRGFDFGDYIPSNEWDITENSSKRHVKKYECCPEIYPDLKFKLRMKRKVAFYNYILILPCVLLSSLTLVLFWLPPESPTKMQLGMNIFVAFFVLLLLLAESTPPAASSIPLIGAYYCLNMVLITLSTFLSVIVVNLYFHGNRTKVPRLLRTIMIDWIASILCMRSYIRDYSRASSKNDKKGVAKLQQYNIVQNQFGAKLASGLNDYGENMFDKVKANGGVHINTNLQDPDVPWKIKPFTNKPANIGNKISNDGLLYKNDRLSFSNDGIANHKYGGRNMSLTRDEPNCFLSQDSVATEALSIDEEKSKVTALLEHLDTEVIDIKSHVTTLTDRISEREQMNKIGQEWKGVALVLDRIFFFIYLIAILISIFTIFPKSALFNWSKES